MPRTSLLLLLLLTPSGCASPGLSTALPSTHAAADHGSLERLGPARGLATKVCGVAGFVDEHPDELMTREATRQAIDAVPDADALVDVIVSSHVSNYALFSMCRVEVVGTAVRVTAARAGG